MLLLVDSHPFSVDTAPYANSSSVTEECQLGSGVAEYSCGALMLLVLATCAGRGLRRIVGQRHVQMDGEGEKMKATHRTADNREKFTTHASSKKEAPLPDYSENLTTPPPSKKETSVLENIAKSSGRSKVDQQHQRHLEIIKNLDRLMSLMPDDESDTPPEFLLNKPRCRVYSQDQAFYSWSSSSTDSSVSIEETPSRKSAEHSQRKRAREELAPPDNQRIIINGDDYSRAIKKRKSDDQKYAVTDLSSRTQCEEVDSAALHNVICSSHRKTTCDAAAQTGTSAQKVTVDVKAQCPESSRDFGTDKGQVFGAVGLEGTKESPPVSGFEAEPSYSAGEWSCFLHNVVPQPKTTQVKTNSISRPKSLRSGFPQVKNKDTPVTVYSKQTKLSPSSKGYTSKSEAQRIKLDKAVRSTNAHYMFSNLEEGAMMPHAQHFEELRHEMSATTMHSMNETSFTSDNDLAIEMTQRTQKFAEEPVLEPTQWDLLYSFPQPLSNCGTPAVNETERCESKAVSSDDTESCITRSNSSFEKLADFICNLKPYEKGNIVVERSQKSTAFQLQYLTGRKLESTKLFSVPTANDLQEDSRFCIPGNRPNTFSTYLHTTEDDFLTSNWRECYSNTETELPGGQERDGKNSPIRQRRDNHETTSAYQMSSSRDVQTSADSLNYSKKQ